MRLAERQRGCVHRLQLAGAGVGRSMVERRLRAGSLHRLFSDVFLVGRPRVEPFGWESAALLHLRGDAVLSHVTAGVVWGLIDEPADLVQITLVGRNARPNSRLRIHRVAALHADDVGRCQGLWATTAARTVVDLAAVLRPVALESAIAVALRERLASRLELETAVARSPRCKGVGVLRELLAAPEPGQLARTRSRYERRLLELIEDAALPRPLVNARVDGLEVDFLWPVERVVVEFDGFAFHGDRAAFERDRARDRRLGRLGYQVVRLTARGVDRTPIATVAELAAILAIRRPNSA